MSATAITPTRSRLIFICVPRSGSTSLLKCLSFLDDDIELWFEPFVISRIARKDYKKETGKELPTEWDEEHDIEFDKASKLVHALNKLPVVEGRKYAYSEVKRSIDNSTKSVVVVKDMATSFSGRVQYLPSPDSGFKYVFIIRDPHRAISSYKKASIGAWRKIGTFGGNDEDFNVLKDDPYFQSRGGCFQNIHSVWQHVRKTLLDPNPLVIDTEDFLAKPKEFLQKICEVGGLKYHDGLLQWDSSSDIIKTWRNVGGVTKMMDGLLEDFHRTAINSSCFLQREIPRERPERSSLGPDVLIAVDEGMEYYQEMYQHRFLP